MVSVDEIVELLRQPGRTASHAATNCSRTDRVRHHPHHLQHGHQLSRRQGPIQVNKGPFTNYVTHKGGHRGPNSTILCKSKKSSKPLSVVQLV